MKSTVSSHERMPTISVFPLRLLALVGLGCCILAGFNISGVTSSQQQQQPEHYSTTMWSDEYPSSSGSPSVDDPLIFVFRLLYRQLEYVIRPLYSENKHTGGFFFLVVCGRFPKRISWTIAHKLCVVPSTFHVRRVR
mmetsp:Transcript_29804/g.81841  ORF Transcript_29804/g.81841 Transcript_29804/m.81841 type:complete len:137 (-) Transcript_29804:1820-2230(-)